mgnify:FL=1
MPRYITVNKQKYLVMREERDAIDLEQLEKGLTDYFLDFDYVVGDWSYGRLRLKGFNSKTNPRFKEINDIDKVDDYLRDFCAYGCRYFIIGKENDK